MGLLAALLGASSGVSCGGSDGGSCSTPAACGGNIVGSWLVTSSCVCTAALAPQSTPETGTYTLSGTSITTTSSTGGGETDSYCAVGNHLDIIPATGSLSSGTTISGSIGLTKQ